MLGLEWDCDKDTLQFDLERLARTAVNLRPTKRNILSVLSDLFDPLGIVSSITVAIKALFQEFIKRKRYSVQLSWKEGHRELPTNFAASQARLKSLLSRLRKDPEILKEYDSVIKNQLEAGIIE